MGFSGGHRRAFTGDSRGYTKAEVAVDLATTLLAPQDRPGARWIPGAAMQQAMFIGCSDSNSFGRFFQAEISGNIATIHMAKNLLQSVAPLYPGIPWILISWSGSMVPLT